MKIPPLNLYYLLCYAWDRLESRNYVDVRAVGEELPQDLFARLLRAGFEQLLKRGLDRGYREHTEDTRRPRGKIDFASTARRALRIRGQVHVRYENLSRDVLHNRIIKTTMRRLGTDPDLDRGLSGDLERLARRIPEVAEVELRDDLFDRVQIHRNNAGYGFLLNLCRLVSRNLIPEHRSGRFRFRDFTGNDMEMGRLFEDFVRNFLRIERRALGVLGRHKQIEWDASLEGNAIRLPVMEADIFVPNVRGRSAILETKCVSRRFSSRQGGPASLKSDHLYQLFAYLANHARCYPNEPPVIGVLLYATDGESFGYRYRIHDHPLWVRSLDLAQPWQEIREELLGLAAELEQQTSVTASAVT